MQTVKYTGAALLAHPQHGAWKPGEERELDEACAAALLAERGDMEAVAAQEHAVEEAAHAPEAAPSRRQK